MVDLFASAILLEMGHKCREGRCAGEVALLRPWWEIGGIYHDDFCLSVEKRRGSRIDKDQRDRARPLSFLWLHIKFSASRCKVSEEKNFSAATLM